MRGSVIRESAAGLLLAAVFGVTATPAWGAEPPPDPPPAAFGAPPPGYEPPPPPSPDAVVEPVRYAPPQAPPSFMTMDRVDSSSRLVLQLGFFKADDTSLDDAFGLRFNPYAQYVHPNGQGGVYAQIPLSHVYLDGEDDLTAWGNPEVGGFFMPTRSSELILRGGLIAGLGRDEVPDVLASLATSLERLTDELLAPPDYWTLRLSASTVREVDMFFFRADAGFDLVIDRPGSAADSPDVFFRGNIAGGLHVSSVDLLAELVNRTALDGEVEGGVSARSNHTLALGVRTQGETQFHLGTVFPLDEAVRGDIWILSLGLMQVLR